MAKKLDSLKDRDIIVFKEVIMDLEFIKNFVSVDDRMRFATKAEIKLYKKINKQK